PFYYFFFSSRRRHTRFSRDWSSDVCSSDLRVRPLPDPPPHRGEGVGAEVEPVAAEDRFQEELDLQLLQLRGVARRRGRQCRLSHSSSTSTARPASGRGAARCPRAS